MMNPLHQVGILDLPPTVFSLGATILLFLDNVYNHKDKISAANLTDAPKNTTIKSTFQYKKNTIVDS